MLAQSFQRFPNLFFNNTNIEEKAPQVLSIEEASKFIQEKLAQADNDYWMEVFRTAIAGQRSKIKECYKIIAELLEEELITVDGYTKEEAAITIYRTNYGLGKIEDYYYDKTVDEIRVAPGGRVFLTVNGKHISTDIYITEEEIIKLIERLKPFDDMGSSLDESSPQLELVRHDGSRLTALCRPVTSTHCFALRKHGNIELTPQNLISLNTFDEKTWNILSLFVKSRRNILICGNTNSGKTTLLKLLISQLKPHLSIRVLDIDNELRASEIFPDREIWELESHPEVGADLKTLFSRVLRITPDIIIVPEFRGQGEVWLTIEACTRGHEGSMASAHFSSFANADEVIRNIAMLALQEGINIPLERVIERVAQSFRIIIQTFSDTSKGVKKIIAVSEVSTINGVVNCKLLIQWQPLEETNYFGEGTWKIVNLPSENLIKEMEVFGVKREEILKAFRSDDT